MKRTLPLSIAALCCAAIAPAAATAAPTVPVVTGEYDLPGEPERPALGPDGNVWVTLADFDNDVVRVAPDGRTTPYDSAAMSFPIGIVAGPDGNLWVAQSGGVAYFSPADPRAARRIDIAGFSGQTLTVGPDGAIWSVSGDEAVRIDPVTRAVTTRRVAGMSSSNGIATGGDGRLYIADSLNGRIVALTTSGDATFIPTGGMPQQIARGLGTQLGYTNPGTNPHTVGVLSPTAAPVTVPVPATDPFGIAFGADQAYWIGNFASSTLTRLAADGTATTFRGLSPGSGPRYLTAGLPGTLWVALETSRRIALISGLEVPQPPPGPPPVDPERPPVSTPPDTTPPVVPPPLPPPPLVPGERRPVLSRVSLTRTTTFGRAARLSLRVAGAGTVTIRLDQQLPGRRGRGGRCAKPSRANRRGRRCARFVQRATTDAPVRNGAVSATLNRRLAVGSYRVTLSAANAAGATTATRSLTVKAQPRPRRMSRRARR